MITEYQSNLISQLDRNAGCKWSRVLFVKLKFYVRYFRNF